MNHVFLLQVHKDSALVGRILHRLEASNHYFAINVDSKSIERKELLQVINSVPNVVLVTEKSISHGGYSFTECTVFQLEYCIKYNVRFDYYHSLSGQDYPCVSNEVFDSIFVSSSSSYMLMDTPEMVEKWREGKYRKRLEQYNFSDIFQDKVARMIRLSSVINRLMLPIKRPYRNLSQIWGGWNWFSLSLECIEYFVNYLSDHPDYLSRFRFTTASDELVFSTVLYYQRQQLNLNVNNSLRYVEWHPNRSYKGRLPVILDERDYDAIIYSGALFCRKVESRTSSILLNMLDDRILNMSKDIVLIQHPKH